MAVQLSDILARMIEVLKQDAFFEDENIPIVRIHEPDQVYNVPDSEVVGVGIPTGQNTDEPELGAYSGGGPVPTSFEAHAILVVKAVGEDGLTTLDSRLDTIGQAAVSAIFGPNLNPDSADDACAFYAFPPCTWQYLPYPTARGGDAGPGLLVWSFRVYRINLEL